MGAAGRAHPLIDEEEKQLTAQLNENVIKKTNIIKMLMPEMREKLNLHFLESAGRQDNWAAADSMYRHRAGEHAAEPDVLAVKAERIPKKNSDRRVMPKGDTVCDHGRRQDEPCLECFEATFVPKGTKANPEKPNVVPPKSMKESRDLPAPKIEDMESLKVSQNGQRMHEPELRLLARTRPEHVNSIKARPQQGHLFIVK